MTIRVVLELPHPAFVWLDVVNPTREELADIAGRYSLHPTSVTDCLDPEHLPKFETFDSYTFTILRAWDEQAPADCTTVQEVTRKLAIFHGPAFLVTIHRKEQRWLTALQQRLAQAGIGRAAVGSRPTSHCMVQRRNLGQHGSVVQ